MLIIDSLNMIKMLNSEERKSDVWSMKLYVGSEVLYQYTSVWVNMWHGPARLQGDRHNTLEIFTFRNIYTDWGHSRPGTMVCLLNQTPFKVNNENRRSEHVLLLNMVTVSAD